MALAARSLDDLTTVVIFFALAFGEVESQPALKETMTMAAAAVAGANLIRDLDSTDEIIITHDGLVFHAAADHELPFQ